MKKDVKVIKGDTTLKRTASGCVERLYFNDETLSSIARGKKVSYQAIQWRKNSILKKLRVLLEEFMK